MLSVLRCVGLPVLGCVDSQLSSAVFWLVLHSWVVLAYVGHFQDCGVQGSGSSRPRCGVFVLRYTVVY